MNVIGKIKSIGTIIIRLLLSYIIPITKGKVMFESFPDYSDNARAFSDYLIQHTDLKLIWSVRDIDKFHSTKRISFIEKNGGGAILGKLRFIYHTVSSEFLFSTHGSFYFANKRTQKYVVLWHGMPLKKIARMQDPNNHDYLNNASFIISTAQKYVPIFKACFGFDEENILPIGIPRNDLLFESTNILSLLGIEKKEGEKLLVYLPTFRKVELNGESDSDIDVSINELVDISTKESLYSLNNFLSGIKVKMLVKPHPSDIHQLKLVRMSNLYIIPHSIFIEKDIQLNHVLHYSDALLTDFSGVFIDYLNLDRPIGFLLSDLAQYTENRGFLFDNPLDYMPGIKIYNKQDFVNFCIDVSNGEDRSKSERERLNKVYNDYNDANNCKRLAERLGMVTK